VSFRNNLPAICGKYDLPALKKDSSRMTFGLKWPFRRCLAAVACHIHFGLIFNVIARSAFCDEAICQLQEIASLKSARNDYNFNPT
jgi:hypothetical protein